jgi:hypothetical protein
MNDLRTVINRVLPESRDPVNDETVTISGYDFWAIRAALAATPEPTLDAERLAREFIHVRGAHNPTADELENDQEVRPCAWCRLAGEQAVEAIAAARLHERTEP